MSKKILLYRGEGRYGMLGHFVDELHKAFCDLGMDATIVLPDNDPHVMYKVYETRPDLSIAYNTTGFYDKGKPIYELLQLQHLAILVDHPAHWAGALSSASSCLHASCVDSSACDFLLNTLNFEKTFFLPHAASRDIAAGPAEKDFQVTLLGSAFDFEGKRKEWGKKFDEKTCKMLDYAVEIGLADLTQPVHEILAQSLEYIGIQLRHDKKASFYAIFFTEVENYLRGKHRIAILRSITDARVDIFGEGDWQSHVADRPNMTIHEAVPAKQAFEIIQKKANWF